MRPLASHRHGPLGLDTSAIVGASYVFPALLKGSVVTLPVVEKGGGIRTSEARSEDENKTEIGRTPGAGGDQRGCKHARTEKKAASACNVL
jgi:hypothetical protein